MCLSMSINTYIMKALKCKPFAQFAYNYTINVLSKCSNIISHLLTKVDTTTIDLRRLAHRSFTFEGRHMYHRFSKVGTSIVDLQKSHIDLRRSTHRSSKVDTSIIKGQHIDLRRSKAETSHRQPNITPTFRQFVTEYCLQWCSMVIPKIPRGTIDIMERQHRQKYMLRSIYHNAVA